MSYIYIWIYCLNIDFYYYQTHTHPKQVKQRKNTQGTEMSTPKNTKNFCRLFVFLHQKRKNKR